MACEERLSGPVVPPVALLGERDERIRGLFINEAAERGACLVHERLHQAGGKQIEGRGGFHLEAKSMGNHSQPPQGGGTIRLFQIMVFPYEVNDRSEGIVPPLLCQGKGLGLVPLLFPWGVKPELVSLTDVEGNGSAEVRGLAREVPEAFPTVRESEVFRERPDESPS